MCCGGVKEIHFYFELRPNHKQLIQIIFIRDAITCTRFVREGRRPHPSKIAHDYYVVGFWHVKKGHMSTVCFLIPM